MDHATDLSIYAMVRNRLPFLEDTPTNVTLVSNFTLEVMWQVEPCLRISVLPDGSVDEGRVGDEDNYSIVQRSLIADLVAIYILQLTYLTAVSAGSSGGSAVATFIKKAKAGSVEVEYDQFDMDSVKASSISPQALIDQLKKSALSKGRGMGCILDICEDCSTAVQTMSAANVVPFSQARRTGGCGCP